MLNAPMSKLVALERAREAADALWDDPAFQIAVLALRSMTVDDAADVFRSQLRSRLEAVCGEMPTDEIGSIVVDQVRRS